MSPLQVTILKIIEANDGKFSWYQLDRALTHRAGVDPGIVSRDLMPALRELEQAGFITASAGYNPAHPLYSVTPKGQEQLEVQRA
jgi:DNA-binding PadR family transcriptional regulator